MSKKAKLYLLIIINLSAWSYLGYKVYGALQGDDDVATNYESPKIKNIDPNIKNDSVHLSLNYADPFLKNGNFGKENKQKKVSSQNMLINQPKPNNNLKPIPTPTIQPSLDIKYLGLVKNNSTGAITALLSINSKSTFVSINSIIEGYIVKQISSEKVLLTKDKENLEIKK